MKALISPKFMNSPYMNDSVNHEFIRYSNFDPLKITKSKGIFRFGNLYFDAKASGFLFAIQIAAEENCML